MKVLNLRNVPDDLMRELRAEAAFAGKPFHPFCVALLQSAVFRHRETREITPRHPPTRIGLMAPPDSAPQISQVDPDIPQEIEIT